MKNLIKTIQNTAFREGLWKRGDKIVLGVSGGADSVCLLDALVKIAKKADLELLIAHVNYGLRGKDSDKDEEFVRELAEKHGVKTCILPKTEFSDFLKLGFRKKPSENELRNIRYDFFEKVRKENNFDLIAAAHNADDQVETFLMHLIRGAGLRGLAAMKYKIYPVKLRQGRTSLKRGFNRGAIIRPLLGITRQEILNYLKKNKLSFRTDKTNTQSLFFRNKIRNKLLPYLEKNFNSQIRKTIFDATAAIAEDYAFIDSYAKVLAGMQKEISVKNILKLHPALQKRVILEKISEIKKYCKDIESAHVEEILKVLRSTKSKNQIVLFKGLKLMRKGDKLIISKLTTNN